MNLTEGNGCVGRFTDGKGLKTTNGEIQPAAGWILSVSTSSAHLKRPENVGEKSRGVSPGGGRPREER